MDTNLHDYFLREDPEESTPAVVIPTKVEGSWMLQSGKILRLRSG